MPIEPACYYSLGPKKAGRQRARPGANPDKRGHRRMSDPNRAPAITIRPLAAADVPKLLDLIDALADYEHLPRPAADARARLTRDATADQPRFRALIAELAGQPVASPDSMPAHQGLMPVPSMVSDSAIMSSQVCGTSQPISANILGEYQTKDFTLAVSGGA